MRLAPLLAGVLATLVTSIAIGVPAPWRDEQATAAASSRSWAQLLDLVTDTTDAVHAAYYALMKPWVDLFGVDPFWLRLPSAIAVGFAAAGIVVLGTMLDRTRTGLIAAAILVLLPRVFWAGGEARSYALQIAVAVWLTVMFVTAVRRGGRWRWIAFAVATAAANWVFLYLALDRIGAARHPRARSGVAGEARAGSHRGDRRRRRGPADRRPGVRPALTDLLGSSARPPRAGCRRAIAVVHGIDGVLGRGMAARRRRGSRDRRDPGARATGGTVPAAAVAHPADRRTHRHLAWSCRPSTSTGTWSCQRRRSLCWPRSRSRGSR